MKIVVIVFAYKSRYEEHKNRKHHHVKMIRPKMLINVKKIMIILKIKTICIENNEFKCLKCNKTFSMIFIYKSKLEEHKNKKKPCKTTTYNLRQ